MRRIVYLLFILFFVRNGCWTPPTPKGKPVPLGDVFEDHWELMDLGQEFYEVVDFQKEDNTFFILTPHSLYISQTLKEWTQLFPPDSGDYENLGIFNKKWFCVATTHPDYLYLTKDGGHHWECLSLPPDIEQCMFISWHPSDSSLFYIFGLEAKRFTPTYGILYKTEDGGKTFSSIFREEHFFGYFHYPFSIDPVNPENLYLGTPAGLYHSPDEGNSWELIYQGSTQALKVTKEGEILLGTSSSLLKSSNRGRIWVKIFEGDGTIWDIEKTGGELFLLEKTEDGFKVFKKGEEWTDISLGLLAYIDLDEEREELFIMDKTYYFFQYGKVIAWRERAYFQVFFYKDTPLPP